MPLHERLLAFASGAFLHLDFNPHRVRASLVGRGRSRRVSAPWTELSFHYDWENSRAFGGGWGRFDLLVEEGVSRTVM